MLCDGEHVDVSVDRQGEFERWLTCGSARHRVISVVDGVHHLVEVDGIPHRVSRDDGGAVRAPAPAVVLSIRVQPGDTVADGDPLVVLEAMKMETAVLAPCSGRVRKVLVRPNVQVVAGAPLVMLEPEREAETERPSERVSFQLERATAPTAEPPAYRRVLDEIRRLMLGYDVDAKESQQLRASWAAAQSELWAEDTQAWASQCEILGIFADLLTIYCDEPAGAFEQRLGGEESLHSYLRSVNLGGKGLAPGFVAKLERALRHYGVEGLEPTAQLDEALLYAHKALRRVDECAAHAFALLEHWVRSPEALGRHVGPELRELLDRLIAATQGRFLTVTDLARQARFVLFDRPLFQTAQQEAYRQVQETLARLVVPRPGDDRAALMDSLVESPHPLMGLLGSTLHERESAVRRLGLEVILRRLYRIRQPHEVRFAEHDGHTVIALDLREGNEIAHVVATHACCSALGEAAAAAVPVLASLPSSHRVSLDLIVAEDGCSVDAQQARREIADALRRAGLERTLAHVCVAVGGRGPGKPLRYFTFVPAPGEAGGYRDHEVHPGMHPMVAQRLEVWRLANFKTEQLPAPEHIYLFHAVARDNPKDERLFSFVDVRDTTPRRTPSGELEALPHLEHLFLEAIAGIREVQARRSARDRLHWNRILLFLWSVADLTPADMTHIARRLAPAAKNLGLEKTVVRMSLREPASGELADRVLHISNKAGTGLRIQFDDVSDQPVRPLTPYAQRVIQLRRLQLLYPYEIIRMLTPSRDNDQAEFPPGEFVEYDLDAEQRLGPVERPHGQNRANVVVGVIRNVTRKHPEGMARVMLLSDPSREMGALSEPECRRIVAAFDLAEQLQVPVDWFPVSSGAKIAMDVGTEGLDWVARVLRRLIEYTQRGGEANVVVTGVNVGGQSYWNAEATMLMHTKGILVMTPQGSMVLTGKRALDYSGGVSAETNQGIGGYERIMAPNGQAQYVARDVAEACHILFRHYEHAYVAPGERFPRRAPTSDPVDRDVRHEPHASINGNGFALVGEVFSADKNPGRKKPFDVRSVMRAVVDKDQEPFERWLLMRDAETAVTWDAHLGGNPICLIGIESKPLPRFGVVPGDGPEGWTGGTLFPQSSKKVARAINAASGNRPVVVLANLSGFDGSPESMRELQLEYGAEIGRAVVNFDGPMVFCVISRYHGGAYVVFSCTLNENLQVAALEGSHASVIGGAPAAAVVFPAEVKARTLADPRVKELQQQLSQASERDKPRLGARYDELYKLVYSEKQGEVAEIFDRVHSVQRAKDVGSLHHIVPVAELRRFLATAVERGMQRALGALAEQSPSRDRHPPLLAD